MQTLLTVMVYDVSCDRRRDRLHALLKQYGVPVQKSVFEGRLTRAERGRVVERASNLIDLATDSFVVYVIGSKQEEGIVALGRPRLLVDAPEWFIC